MATKKRTTKIGSKKITSAYIKGTKYPKLSIDTPNFPRIVKIYKGYQLVSAVIFRGYLSSIHTRFDNITFIVSHNGKDFDAKQKNPNRNNYSPAINEKIASIEQTAHVFLDHDCIAEISFRGYLNRLIDYTTICSFHMTANENLSKIKNLN